jgi:transcriptional regulator GlxA family with amidase domain
MRIAIAILDGVFDSGLSVLLDIFTTAAALSGRRFEVVRLGARTKATTAQGAVHSVERWQHERRRFEHYIVPGFACYDVEAVERRLDGADAQSLSAWLVGASARRASIHAACTGTWVLGRSGLLDGHEATTSWWFADAFRQAFPRVELDARQSVVRSGAFITAGAAFAHIDLALALLRSESPALAERVSNHLVTESRASQALYLVEHHARVDDPVVRQFEALMATRLRDAFDLEAAAHTLGTSSRTLQRKVKLASGQSPLQLVQRLRLRQALAMLRQGDVGLDGIAEAVGYRSGHTLRMLIRRELAVGIRELRGGGR